MIRRPRCRDRIARARLRYRWPCASAVLTSAAQAEPRAVIELFTSQGCSSCPPADKLIGEYARDPSRHRAEPARSTTGTISAGRTRWRCPATPTASAPIAKARGDREVYTPQVVIDGAVHALGSDKAAIEQRDPADARAELGRCSLPVTLSSRAGDQLTVTVPAAKDEKGQGRSLAVPDHQDRCRLSIGRGENSGHTITYTNVVRRWIKLGDWTGKARRPSMCRCRTCRPAASMRPR